MLATSGLPEPWSLLPFSMKVLRNIIWGVLAVMLMSQFNPQSTRITEAFFPDYAALANVTPALQKDKGFTDHEELMAFVQKMATDFPQLVRVQEIGQSKKGLNIPMLLLSKPTNRPKLRVWLQGGLHGDEPASTESMLYLVYDLLHNAENAPLLEALEIAIVPMANIDGYLKQQRNNAEDIDLNRDQTKLMGHETPLLKKAFAAFDPQVALDFHEFRPYRRDFAKLGSFGVTSAYDLMFLYSGNLNVPPALRAFTDSHFLNPARQKLTAAGLRHHDYFTTDEELGSIHFNMGSNSARSSATNFALQNRISTLFEVRGVGIGRTSFKRRIYSGYLVALTYLQQAAKEPDAIRMAIAAANQYADSVTVKSVRKIYKHALDFIDIDKVTLLPIELEVHDAGQTLPRLRRARPAAYVLDADQGEVVAKIRTFGFQVREIKTDTSLQAEQYLVKTYKKSAQKYEQVFTQTVSTQLQVGTVALQAGAFLIPMQQPMSNLLPELLEPEAPNSLVFFGLIPAKQGAILPIYRLLAP